MSKAAKDRLIGVGVTFFTMIVSFLAYQFTSSFVTYAQYNEDKAVIEVMRSDIKHIREKVDFIYKRYK